MENLWRCHGHLAESWALRILLVSDGQRLAQILQRRDVCVCVSKCWVKNYISASPAMGGWIVNFLFFTGNMILQYFIQIYILYILYIFR